MPDPKMVSDPGEFEPCPSCGSTASLHNFGCRSTYTRRRAERNSSTVELTIKHPNALLSVERREITGAQANAVLTLVRPGSTDLIDPSYSILMDALEGHDDECVWRCLQTDCHSSHGCNKCGDDEDEELPPAITAYVEQQAQEIDKVAHPDSEWARERREGKR